MSNYLTIKEGGEGLYKEKGSKFMAFARHAATVEEAKELVASLRREHHKARHVCFAYRIGPAAEVYRGADDGEPAGTGGRPILRCLETAGLTDSVIAVVRYYGGRPLGTGGLARAYRAAAEEAIATSKLG